MYNTFYLKDFNIFSKFISFIIWMLSLFYLQSKLGLLLFVLLFFSLFKNIKLLIIEMILIIISFFVPSFLLVLKGMLIMKGIYFLIKIINIEEIRFLIEKITYRIHSNKLCMPLLSFCYFWRLFYLHFFDLKKEYLTIGRKLDFKQYAVMIKKSYEKSKIELKKVIRTYEYRFYHISTKRTYLEDISFTSIDMKYVLLHVILFFLVFVYGR